MSLVSKATPTADRRNGIDFKVADLGDAAFGRTEIRLSLIHI